MSLDLDEATVERMVSLVEPSLEIRTVSPVDRGWSTVYRLELDGSTPTAAYLKAEPGSADDDGNIPTEARVLATLAGHTSIPVPTVRGVLDDHETLPAPFYLMDACRGAELEYARVGWLTDDELQRLAHGVGAALGELHALDAVESYGGLDHAGPALAGERPRGDPSTLSVDGGHENWPAFLRAWIERELDRHEESRFGELTPRLRSWCTDRLAELDGPFRAVLGRNDHGLHNLLLDPETRAITAMLDWAYTLAVTPAFDFEYAAYIYGGSYIAGLPEVSDRRALVRDAMSTGYRASSPGGTTVPGPEPLYELLAMVRLMNDFESLVPQLPGDRASMAADSLRSDVVSLIEPGE